MSIVAVSALHAGRTSIEHAESFSGQESVHHDQAYAFLLVDVGRHTSLTMRIAVHEGRFVWRDRDGAVDKQLEMNRLILTDQGAIVPFVDYSTIKFNDIVTVTFARSRDNVRQSQHFGTVFQINVYA